MKRNLCLLALLCLFFKLPAQEQTNNQPNITALAKGDKVPDVAFANMLNHPTGEARLSDYKGQWILLDFWATWCSPCITALPKMDSLQKAFEGKVQFLPVTYQSQVEVEKLLTRLEKSKGKSIQLPMVVSDKALHAFFPHKELPYYIWVNPEGFVEATTDHREVTAENIEAMLAGKSVKMKTSQYVPSSFNKNENLLAGNTALEKEVRFQSALLPYIEGLSSGYTVFPTDQEKGKRILATNARLLSLFQLAHSNAGTYFTNNRTLLNVADTLAFVSGKSGNEYKAWLADGNSWCYELIVPASAENQALAMMQEDLQRYFPQYSAMVETRNRPCLVLVQMDRKPRPETLKKLATKGGGYLADFSVFGGEIRNGLLTDMVARLNAYYLQKIPTPVIDESGITEKIDLVLEADMTNVAEIRKALNMYGLDLVEEEREIEVLVIGDRD